MAEKVVVPYEHDSQDLTQIWLAFSPGTPADEDWRPVLRDIVDGRRVVWVKYDQVPHGNLWIKDRAGVRRAVQE
jgi:hypothetical protein